MRHCRTPRPVETRPPLHYHDENMTNTNQNENLSQYVERAVGPGSLALRVIAVMRQLPTAILADFLNDPGFRLALDDLVPGQGRTVWLACPTPGNGSRCVVLKPRLADCEQDFAHYIIAHELAHAHLRNRGWQDIEDPERAADALAAHWGFRRPPHSTSNNAT